MFFHNFKYCIKTMINGKVTLFWTLIFPIALATFMYMAMGNLMEKDEMFKDVKVALVEQETDNSLMLTTLFSSIKGENDEALIELEVMIRISCRRFWVLCGGIRYSTLRRRPPTAPRIGIIIISLLYLP